MNDTARIRVRLYLDRRRLPSSGERKLLDTAYLDVEVDEHFAPLVLSNVPDAVTEGMDETYKVRLVQSPRIATPPHTIKVTLESLDTDALTVSPSTLNFNINNWNTDQTVTVTGVQDGNSWNENVTITHSTSGAHEFDNKSQSIDIETEDDDTADIVISESKLTLIR